MDWAPGLLGPGLAATMEARATSVVLRLGRDTFTRVAFAHVECFNFLAAENLSRILDRELTGDRAIADTRALYERIDPRTMLFAGLGGVSFAVLGAAFEIRGLGGQSPLANWFKRHATAETVAVTFATLKRHAASAAAAAPAETPPSSPARGPAPRVRVSRRHTTRQRAGHHGRAVREH